MALLFVLLNNKTVLFGWNYETKRINSALIFIVDKREVRLYLSVFLYLFNFKIDGHRSETQFAK